MYCNNKVGGGYVLGWVTMVSVIYWGFGDKHNLQFIFIYYELRWKDTNASFFAES